MILSRATRPTPPSRNPERRSFALMNSASDFRHTRQAFHMPLRGPPATSLGTRADTRPSVEPRQPPRITHTSVNPISPRICGHSVALPPPPQIRLILCSRS